MTGSSDSHYELAGRWGYVAIADHLEHRIREGEFAPGDQLPGRREIADQYGVSTKTASNAGALLVRRGLAFARSGAGTYVTRAVNPRRIRRTPGREQGPGSPWRADAARAGLVGAWDSRSTFRQPAPADIAERLGIEPGEACTRTDYVFTAAPGPDDEPEPVMLSTSWEPHAITGQHAIIAPETGPLAGRGVRERMESIGVTMLRATEAIGVRPVAEAEARLLRVPSEVWVLTITRTYYGVVDGVERPVETADLRYPGDRYEVMYDIPLRPRDDG